MKRQLKFRFENGNYVIKEGDSIVFSIDAKTLKFISLDLYLWHFNLQDKVPFRR